MTYRNMITPCINLSINSHRHVRIKKVKKIAADHVQVVTDIQRIERMDGRGREVDYGDTMHLK